MDGSAPMPNNSAASVTLDRYSVSAAWSFSQARTDPMPRGRHHANPLVLSPATGRVATVYGELRADCAARGVSLGALDMMIAAQAVAAGALLVTRDEAFDHVKGALTVEAWT
jgi:predicted nucleic acid-binding protein